MSCDGIIPCTGKCTRARSCTGKMSFFSWEKEELGQHRTRVDPAIGVPKPLRWLLCNFCRVQRRRTINHSHLGRALLQASRRRRSFVLQPRALLRERENAAAGGIFSQTDRRACMRHTKPLIRTARNGRLSGCALCSSGYNHIVYHL